MELQHWNITSAGGAHGLHNSVGENGRGDAAVLRAVRRSKVRVLSARTNRESTELIR